MSRVQIQNMFNKGNKLPKHRTLKECMLSIPSKVSLQPENNWKKLSNVIGYL